MNFLPVWSGPAWIHVCVLVVFVTPLRHASPPIFGATVVACLEFDRPGHWAGSTGWEGVLRQGVYCPMQADAWWAVV